MIAVVHAENIYQAFVGCRVKDADDSISAERLIYPAAHYNVFTYARQSG
jgi:hypothetical protein